MIEQDGRLSESDVDIYQQRKNKSEETKYARLIVEGHQMIRNLNRCPPYPLVLLKKIPYLGILPPFWRDTLFGLGFVGAWTGFSYLIDYALLGMKPPEFVIRFLLAAVLVAAIAGIRIMSTRTIDALDEMVTLVEKHEALPQIEATVYSLFRSPGQHFITLSLFIVYFYSSVILGGQYSINILFVFLLFWLCSPLIWFLIRGVWTTYWLSQLKDLETNPLSPMKTLGLQKWIAVVGSYALVGSIVLTAGGSIPLLRSFIMDGAYTVWKSIWLVIFLPIVLMTWTYPYFKLKGLVKKIKRKRMHLLKTIISRTFEDWVRLERCLKGVCSVVKKDEPDKEKIIGALKERSELYGMIRPEFDQMKEYHAVFKEIDKSPESFFDFRAALELAQVMGIPTLFAALSYLIEQWL